MSFGKKIAQLRQETSLSQRDLAKKFGVHFQSIGRWERDESMPDAQDIKKLAEFFKVTTDFLFFENVPRDGKVDIHDLDLMRQFEDADGLPDEKRAVVKQLLDAFLLKEKIEKDINRSKKAR